MADGIRRSRAGRVLLAGATSGGTSRPSDPALALRASGAAFKLSLRVAIAVAGHAAWTPVASSASVPFDSGTCLHCSAGPTDDASWGARGPRNTPLAA